MTETPTPGAHSAIRVLAALAELGETTAAAIAEHVGIAYSTTTPKLRTWENTGQAERVRTDDGRTLWRLTAAGRAATATTEPHPAGAVAAPQPDDQPASDTHTEPATDTTAITTAPSDSTDSAPTTTDDPTGQDERATQLPAVDDQPSEGVTPDPAGSRPQLDPADPTAADTELNAEQSTPTTAPPSTDEGEPSQDTTAPVRRAPGSLRASILDICEANPDRQYKVGELCRLIDANNAGTDAKRASQGAVSNACTKLAANGSLTQTLDKPATFRLAPTGD